MRSLIWLFLDLAGEGPLAVNTYLVPVPFLLPLPGH